MASLTEILALEKGGEQACSHCGGDLGGGCQWVGVVPFHGEAALPTPHVYRPDEAHVSIVSSLGFGC